MRPELFVIPFINISIKSYGSMMVLGFLSALFIARRNARKLNENPDHVTNFTVYAMIAGVIGARIFHVIHFWKDYENNFAGIFAIWSGGLEFLGGFIGATIVMIIYFRRHNESVLRFLDILAPALMFGLAFGRVGCLMNGCCFGSPTDLPWAITFPALNSHTSMGCQGHTADQYSIPFENQINDDDDRNRGPLVVLGDDYYAIYLDNNNKPVKLPKPISELTPQQIAKLNDGTYKMVPVHPTQTYSTVNALLISAILTLLWRYRKKDGQIFAVMIILYGVSRYLIESIRSDSPIEFTGLTISQNLSVVSVALGVALLIWLKLKAPLQTK